MTRSKKKTVGQKLVGVAAIGMPQPVRQVASTRWGARVFLILIAILFFTGVVSLQWTDGRPALHVDRERARDLKQGIVEEIATLRGQEKQPTGKFQWFNSKEQPVEPSLMGKIFGQESSKPDSTKTSLLPGLESAAEFRDHVRELPAQVLPKSAEKPAAEQVTRFPWSR